MQENDYILDIKDISKEFPGVQALNQVSFSVRRGNVHALVGENGAGKSTLIKILTGIYKPDSGKLYLNNKEVAPGSPLEAQKLGLSVVHQEIKLVETLSVAENIFMGRPFTNKYGIVDWKKTREEAGKLLEGLHITLDPNEEVSRLSLAQKQIVEICKALSYHSKLIIMDEPSATLTEKELESLFGIIGRLKEAGITVIYISHRMEEIFSIADMVTVLRDGCHIRTVPVKEVNRQQLITLMVGREIGSEYPKMDVPIGDVAIEIKNLTRKGYLEDISIYAKHGEIVGLAGLVGAGRTEIARAVFAADRKSGGEIYLDGKKVYLKNIRDAIKHKIALIPEDRKTQGLILGMSIRKNTSIVNLDLVSKHGILSKKKDIELAEKLIDKLHISTTSPIKIVRDLSGGNQQKVVLAKWLAVDSEVIFMDEPTRGIDVGAKAEIYKLMGELALQGKAVIVISSDMPELIGVCDRIYVVREGRISGELAREAFSQEAILDLAVS